MVTAVGFSPIKLQILLIYIKKNIYENILKFLNIHLFCMFAFTIEKLETVLLQHYVEI